MLIWLPFYFTLCNLSVKTALSVEQTATLNAKIFLTPAGSNTFSPTGASVNLVSNITSTTAVVTVAHGVSSTFPPVSVAAGDCLLMVYLISGPTSRYG